MNSNHIFVNGYKYSVEIDLVKRKYYHRQYKYNNIFTETTNQNKFINPAMITNAVITIDKSKQNLENLEFIFEHLEHLLCKYIVVDCEYVCCIDDVKKISSTLNTYNIHEVLLLLVYSDELYSDEFLDIILSSDRYKSIIIFNSPFDKNLEDTIHYYKQNKKFNYYKNKNEFIPIYQLHVEAIYYHTYFNRKLYIGAKGEIKNAKETNVNFGYIYDCIDKRILTNIICSNEFQEYWNVTKDKCDVCKHCEFRYMCVDNRLPYKRNHSEWYHKIECNYNPYIGKWSDNKDYKTLSECGIISNEHMFHINCNFLQKINAQI